MNDQHQSQRETALEDKSGRGKKTGKSESTHNTVIVQSFARGSLSKRHAHTILFIYRVVI